MGRDGSARTPLPANTLLVDVRTPFEYASGTIDGAINIPLGQLDNMSEKLKAHPHILLFCKTGNRSMQALTILQSKGFPNITNGGSLAKVKKLLQKQQSVL